jgi:UDP-N-acetyl-2-amino-2-deoxyglucuronate dehydrogenase
MPTPLKLAFLGCGAIARFHLDGILEQVPDIRVTAAIDTDADKAQAFADETGAQAFSSLDEALAQGDFDAVDIMLPHDLHEETAIRCFKAGKHVLLEKPMAPTLDACQRILTAAQDSGRVFMIAENAQYWPEVVKARDLIQQGAIGEVFTARAAFVMEFDSYWFKEQKPWRFQLGRTGGGIAIDGGSHWLRPLRLWMGEIESIVGAVDRPLGQMEGESLSRALIRFRSGKIASFDCMMPETVLGPEAWWRVTGSRGELVIQDGFAGGLYLYDPDHRDGRLVMPPQGYAQSFGPELADFAAAVLYGKELEAGPEQSLGELRAALSLYRSVESGRWEQVWD